jgi:hypothetical protein
MSMMKQLRMGGLWLVVLALCLACKTAADPAPTMAVTSAGSSTGGSGGTSTGAAAQGGADDMKDEVRKGERGSSCDSTNDCAEGLSCGVAHDCPVGVSCANKSCQPTNFALTGTGKRCFTHDCTSIDDCCGEMPQQAPAKCAKRESICNRPSLPGCTPFLSCMAQKDCGTGKCAGTCSAAFTTTCLAAADCAPNTCDPTTHKCSVTGFDCSLTACALNVCSFPRCNCTNPDYDQTNPICIDEECQGICGFTCKDERCVVDTSCASDDDCSLTTPFCNNTKCGECRTSDDCEKEECIAGHCGPICKTDTQCPLFEACQAGECVFVGCRSDRECVLKAGTTTQDPRLAKCRVENGRGACVFPCEIDAQCAPSEVCLDGVCEYIGCETDGECKTIAGLHNLPAPTPERPWSTTAQCRPESIATP